MNERVPSPPQAGAMVLAVVFGSLAVLAAGVTLAGDERASSLSATLWLLCLFAVTALTLLPQLLLARAATTEEDRPTARACDALVTDEAVFLSVEAADLPELEGDPRASFAQDGAQQGRFGPADVEL